VNELNKKAIILMSLMILTVIAFPCLSTVQAKITEVNDLEGCTEYYGTMAGANFYVLIPDDWTNDLGDGMLVVSCRGASIDDLREGAVYEGNVGLAASGIAVAASDYGTKGFDAKFGVILTHQLTEYVIDNYGVTGKVFLYSESIGGSIALVLGARYPDVYSGVLDVSGIKDWAMEYNYAAENLVGSGDPILALSATLVPGSEETYGGTADEKPQKYAKYSATSYTDLSIPVISIVHLYDQIVPYEQTTYYHSLVGDEWHVVVTVPLDFPGSPFPSGNWYGHFDPYLTIAAPIFFELLVHWSNGDIVAGDIPTTFP
jgi:hypothetical protein